MAYDPYKAINSIYNLKGQWNGANSKQDNSAKNQIAQKATRYYNQLRQNGYDDIANELEDSNYEQAKTINDKYAKTGKSAIRPYFYNTMKQYGYDKRAVDDAIQYDNDTGEVYVGGQNIGTPYSVVDGVSYWDSNKLKSAVDDFVTRNNITHSKETLVNQANDSIIKKYEREYEDLKKINPFETEEGKSILGKYDLSALRGRDNAVASGASTNGGNIDSFAAANAMRQQAALISQGQEAVLASYNQKLEHARKLLSDMGVNTDRIFNEDETAKNNRVSRDVATSEVTGIVPESMSYANNIFFNADGTLKNVEQDYKEIINNAQEKLKTTTNERERADLENTINMANQARNYKMANYKEYAKYADSTVIPTPEQTANYKLENKKIESAERISNTANATNLANTNATLQSNERINALNNQSNERINAQNNQNALAQIEENKKAQLELAKMGVGSGGVKPELTLSQATTAIKNGSITPKVIKAYNYYTGGSYTVENPPNVKNGKTTSSANDADTLWKEFTDKFTKDKVNKFISEHIRPLYNDNAEITNEGLKDLIINNSEQYDIDVEDARTILEAFGADTTWLQDYKNRWGFNSGKGMKYIK